MVRGRHQCLLLSALRTPSLSGALGFAQFSRQSVQRDDERPDGRQGKEHGGDLCGISGARDERGRETHLAEAGGAVLSAINAVRLNLEFGNWRRVGRAHI